MTCLILILFASAAFASQPIATMTVWQKIRDLSAVDCPQAERMVARVLTVAPVLTIAAKAFGVSETAEASPIPILERVARSPVYPVWPAELTDWKVWGLASSALVLPAVPLVHRASVAAWLVLATAALAVDPV